MALTDENSGIPATMLVGPTNYPMGNGGFGNTFGGDGWWVILLILLFAGGWNNGGFGGNGGFYGVDNGIQRGFDQNAVMNGISGIQNGVQGISTQLCNGFAGVNTAITGAQNAIAQQLYTNQLADLERSYAAQTASTAGFTNVSAQLANCCCENRLATESLRATVLQENCSDRYEAANNTRDIIDNANRNNQAIIDKLCQLELDGKNDRIAELERQLTMANLAASQTAQTAQLLADNNRQTVALEQYLNPVPIPAYVVQNPNCCTQTACGCNF